MNPLADIDNLCFLDFETRALPGVSESDGSVKSAGTYRYAKSSRAIIMTYAIGGGPVRCVETWDRMLRWRDMPAELQEFFGRVVIGNAWFAAFNAGFDRNVWNHGTDFPTLRVEDMIDMMAQVQASNLPASLAGVAKVLGLAGKLDEGKRLIYLFCMPKRPGVKHGTGTPETHPAEWETFRQYAIRDTALLPEIFRSTRALSWEEWQEYWASERINERGVAIDLPFVERAAAVAAAEAGRINAKLAEWSDGAVIAVTQVAKLANWIYDRIEDATARELMVAEWINDETAEHEEGEIVETGKLSLARRRIEAILAYYKTKRSTEFVDRQAKVEALVAQGATEGEKAAAREALLRMADREYSPHDRITVDALTLRLYGGGASPFKFKKMLDQHDDGFLKGQYVFNGAAQTGRFSSKGTQIHNLTRTSLSCEEEAIEMINEAKL